MLRLIELKSHDPPGDKAEVVWKTRISPVATSANMTAALETLAERQGGRLDGAVRLIDERLQAKASAAGGLSIEMDGKATLSLSTGWARRVELEIHSTAPGGVSIFERRCVEIVREEPPAER